MVTALQTSSSSPHAQQELAAGAYSYFSMQEQLQFIGVSRLAGTATTPKGKPVDGKRGLLAGFVLLIIQRVFVLCSLVWMKSFTLQ